MNAKKHLDKAAEHLDRARTAHDWQQSDEIIIAFHHLIEAIRDIDNDAIHVDVRAGDVHGSSIVGAEIDLS
jgi:hypothetical protein